MNNYDFKFESLDDKIRDLKVEVERLKDELIETDNTIYEILIRLDKLENLPYSTSTFKGA